MTKEAKAARLALEHCGVIRASAGHVGYFELFCRDIATATRVPSAPGMRDYRLAA